MSSFQLFPTKTAYILRSDHIAVGVVRYKCMAKLTYLGQNCWKVCLPIGIPWTFPDFFIWFVWIRSWFGYWWQVIDSGLVHVRPNIIVYINIQLDIRVVHFALIWCLLYCRITYNFASGILSFIPMTSLGFPTILVKRMVFSNYDINSVKIKILPFFSCLTILSLKSKCN